MFISWLLVLHFSLQLEQRVNEIEQFYSTKSKKQLSTSKASSTVKDKDKEKHIPSIKRQQQDASRREAAAAKRMQELMRQFGTILRQVKSSYPFYHMLLLRHFYVLSLCVCVCVCVSLFIFPFWDLKGIWIFFLF